MSTPGTGTGAVGAPSQAEKVLSRAVLRAADALGISRRELAEILGVSAASLSRLCGTRWMSPQSKEGELGLLFIRVFRSLDALVGGDPQAARAWLGAANTHLGGVPGEMLARVEGLVRVAEYLDAMRGRI